MWTGTAILTIGSGLIYTLKVDSNAGLWIGYQIVAGFGIGLALQTPFIAVQRALSAADMAQGSEYPFYTQPCRTPDVYCSGCCNIL